LWKTFIEERGLSNKKFFKKRCSKYFSPTKGRYEFAVVGAVKEALFGGGENP